MDQPVVVVIGTLALAVGLTVAAITGHEDRLRSDVSSVLKAIERPVAADTHLFVEIHGRPQGVPRGIQFGLLALVLGGVPMAVIGRALLRYSNPDRFVAAAWSGVFQAGLIFQLSSIGLSAFLVGVLVWAAIESADAAAELMPIAGPLSLIAGCGAWGASAWRGLRDAVQPASSVSIARL
jgi:hypothetical protein